MMRNTTTALALAGTLLAAPAVALAAAGDDPPSPRPRLARHWGTTVAAQMSAERSPNLQRRPHRPRRAAGARASTSPARAERARLRGQSPTGEIRARIRRLERLGPPAPTASPTCEAIAACESGGNPATDTGNGFYGKYQFTLETWAGRRRLRQPGAGLRGRAGPPRRRSLYAQSGPSPWPVCGR